MFRENENFSSCAAIELANCRNSLVTRSMPDQQLQNLTGKFNLTKKTKLERTNL